MAFWTRAHALAMAMLCVGVWAHAEPPPLSRIEAALDLSTPEAAAGTYSEAYADDDFLAVYFALAPAARERFTQSIALFRLSDIVAGRGDFRVQGQVMDGDLGPYEHAADQDRPFISSDMFHVFQTVLWSADRRGLHLIDFAGPVAVLSVGEPYTSLGEIRVEVEATDELAGPVRFHLQQAPSGRWRVLSVVARPGGADEAVFLPLTEEDGR